MKNFILSAIITIAGYVLLLIFDTNQTAKADKIITTIEGICFAFTFFVHLYGLINLISAERDNRSNKKYIKDAKKFILMGLFMHIGFVILSVLWLDSIRRSHIIDLNLDILYGLLNMFMCCYSWIGLQFVMNTTVHKSIIPGVGDPSDKLIGECLIVLGVSKDVIEKALEMQRQSASQTRKKEEVVRDVIDV